MLRKPKFSLDPLIPYHFLHEQEPNEQGKVQEVNTIFLSSRTCIFQCIFCDLWKHTIEGNVQPGAIPQQIQYALLRLPAAQVIKLYNNGNFFDRYAVPPVDYPQIARLLTTYERVIVENHPALCGPLCVEFQQQIGSQLEIAMGLETIHPQVLPRLNKRFTLSVFQKAAHFLREHEIDIRVFILLNPPFITDPDQSIHWALKSIDFAFTQGATCCTIIPVRATTFEMQDLQRRGLYVPATIDMLEEVQEKALAEGFRRVFIDTWDVENVSTCPHCFVERKHRLERINLYQQLEPRIHCVHCQSQ
ncbi:MAG: hypothetical protein K6T34_02735 [Thermoflavifilum sp.]|nr:hypothetical protein [Thermoflavifilum sp.]